VLDVSRQRVDERVRTRDGFPEAAAILAAGPIWERADIEARATGGLPKEP
jgi:hypothetical protein